MTVILANLTWTDGVGSFGTFIIAMSYFATQMRYLNSEHILFPLSNLIGSLLISFSLYFSFNFPSALMELVWIVISIVGIFQWFKCRANSN